MANDYAELEVGERVLKVEIRRRGQAAALSGGGEFKGVAPAYPPQISRLRMEEVMAVVRDAAESLRREIGSRVPGLASLEVTFGLSIEAEADLWIAATKGEANFEVKIVLEPRGNDQE